MLFTLFKSVALRGGNIQDSFNGAVYSSKVFKTGPNLYLVLTGWALLTTLHIVAG